MHNFLLSIEQAVVAIKLGKIIAYPTEGVFGLGCDPQNAGAVEQILQIKQRDSSKGLILVANDVAQVKQYADLNTELVDKLQQIWTADKPHFVTCLLPVNHNCPANLCGAHKTIAVRVSQHPVIVELCSKFGGAIVSTSANITNQTPALNYAQVVDYFSKYMGSQIAGVVVGELGGANKSSQIISFVDNNIKILRE